MSSIIMLQVPSFLKSMVRLLRQVQGRSDYSRRQVFVFAPVFLARRVSMKTRVKEVEILIHRSKTNFSTGIGWNFTQVACHF